MPHLVRPYPVALLPVAAEAIRAATGGDVGPLQRLYVEASDALFDLDPDEIKEHMNPHHEASSMDRAALRAAIEVHETWEGIVAVGSSISDPRRFRAFAWSAARARYHAEMPNRRAYKAFGEGLDLPGESPEDSALFAALPALIGLGPELSDELSEPGPIEGVPVWQTLGLLSGDWSGVDPIDGRWLSPEDCKAHYSSSTGVWREVLGRGAAHGLLVREAD